MQKETKPKNPWLKRFIIYLVLALLPYILVYSYMILALPKEERTVCFGWLSSISLLMVIASIISYIMSRRSKKFRILALEFSFSMLLGFLFGFVAGSSLVQPVLKPFLVSLGFSC